MEINNYEHVITGHTRLVGLLGYPIKHSRSPRLQNLSFARNGIDLVYLTFDVHENNLEDAIKAMRTLNVAGFNVTMPNKQRVIPLLDELSEEARIIGAVNTVSHVDGVLKGYNTDGMGFIKNLEDNGVDCRGKRVVQCGAGGAGSACAVQMALSGAKELVILDVSLSSAQLLANNINKNIKGCKACAFTMEQEILLSELAGSDIYVDSTPLGMHPLEEQAVFTSPEQIPQELTVVDVSYSPVMTKLLKMAETRGCKYVTGIGMNYNQGAIAFKIWTGQDMPLDYVRAKMEAEGS